MKARCWWALALAGVACIAARAQEPVYKCGEHSYAQHPCSATLVDTRDAPVPPGEGRRPRIGQASTVAMRRLPGETDSQLATRRRRAGLPAAERQECVNLERRMAFEVGLLDSPASAGRIEPDDTLERSNRRYRELKC